MQAKFQFKKKQEPQYSLIMLITFLLLLLLHTRTVTFDFTQRPVGVLGTGQISVLLVAQLGENLISVFICYIMLCSSHT